MDLGIFTVGDQQDDLTTLEYGRRPTLKLELGLQERDEQTYNKTVPGAYKDV